MHPTLAHLALLGFFMLGAKLISLVAKRPINGAFGYLIAAGLLALLGILQIFNPDMVPPAERAYVLGALVGSLAIPVGLAIYLSIRHNARTGSAISTDPTPDATAVATPTALGEPPQSASLASSEPDPKVPFHLPLLILGWQIRKFWDGKKSLAAAFWGLGVAGTVTLFFLALIAGEVLGLFLIIMLPLYALFAAKCIWACSANTKHKVFRDLVKTLLVLLAISVVVNTWRAHYQEVNESATKAGANEAVRNPDQ